MECLLPHDALHSSGTGCRFYAGFSHTGTVELNNGVIGSAPGHRLLTALIERIDVEHGARQEEQQRRAQEQARRQAQLASIMGFLGQREAAAMQGVVAKGKWYMSKLVCVDVAGDLILPTQPTTAEGHQAAMATIERTGPGLFTRVCAEHLLSDTNDKDGSILLLPPQWFYALPNTESRAVAHEGRADQQRRALFVAPGVTHAVHHWARSWQT